jgi:hypothetical protein
MEAIKSAVIRVDDVVPISVEALCSSMVGIDENGRMRLCMSYTSATHEKPECVCNNMTVHERLLDSKREAVNGVPLTAEEVFQ